MESPGGAPDRSTGPKPCLFLLLLTHLPGRSKTTQNPWVALLAYSCLGLDGEFGLVRDSGMRIKECDCMLTPFVGVSRGAGAFPTDGRCRGRT